MRKRLNKIVSTFVAGMLCMSFVPLTAIASDAGIELTNDAAIVEIDEGEETSAPVEVPQETKVVESEEAVGNAVAGEMVEGEGETETVEEASVVEETKIDTVVKIGDEEFSSLEDAMMYLARSRALSYNMVPVDFVADVVGNALPFADVTYNLNGYTWTARNDTALFSTRTALNITINGPGTIQAADGYRAIEIAPRDATDNKSMGGKLTLNNVTLRGNGSGIGSEPTVSPSSNARAVGGIVYSQGADIEANNCIFESGANNATNSYGGAIFAYPYSANTSLNIGLNSCEFRNNVGKSGSAVSAIIDNAATGRSISLNAKGCTFENNSGSSAIRVSVDNTTKNLCTTTVNVTNSTFKNNSGAVYTSNRSIAPAIAIEGCTFESNTSSYGGAIFAEGSTSNAANGLHVTDCAFNSNTATSEGGAVYGLNIQAPIEDSSFDKNVAASYGGAIVLKNLQEGTVAKGCTFTGNKEESASFDFGGTGGGALYVASSKNQTLNVENCIFCANTAGANGGAVYIPSGSLKALSIVGGEFVGNTAGKGGAIAATIAGLALEDTVISGNSATYKNTGINKALVTAGGIHFIPEINGAVLEFKGDSHVYNNLTPNEYTSLLVNGVGASSEVLVADTSSKATTVSGLEGTKFTDESGIEYTTMKYSNASFNSTYKLYQRFYSEKVEPFRIYLDPAKKCKHTASEKVAVYTSLKDAYEAVTSKDDVNEIIICSSVNVESDDDAYLNPAEGADVTYSRCSGNHSSALFEAKGDVTFSNVVLNGKGIQSNAAMIKVNRGAHVTLSSGAVLKKANRTANVSGETWSTGGAAVELAYGTDPKGNTKLTIDGATLTENTCTGDGGAIWSWKGTVSINNGTFSNNTAGRWGGFLCTATETDVNISGGSFVGNVARKQGGALSLWSYGGKATVTTITGGLFDRNVSNMEWTDPEHYYAGGAIYNDRYGTLNLRDVIAYNNNKKSCESTKEVMGASAIANCPWADFTIFEQHGALVYDNGPKQGDVSWIATSDSKGTGTVTDTALGGGDCNWKGIDLFGTGPLFDIPQSDYQLTHSSFNLVSQPSEETIDLAWKQESKVIFTNNESYLQGSAVMNNGTMRIGADMKALSITKAWKDKDGQGLDEADIPGSIEVTLAYIDANGNVKAVDENTRKDRTKVLDADHEWTAGWTDLGTDTEWTVVETAINGYEGEVTLDRVDESGSITKVYKTLTNTWNEELTNIAVQKWWEDQDNAYQIQPSSIELTLKTDNGAVDADRSGTIDESEYVAVGESVKVEPNEDGDWRYDFTGLAKYTKKGEEIKYLIVETPVAGYVSKVEPVVTGQKPVLDENGEQVTDEEGNPVFEDVYTWSIMPIAEGDEGLEDATAEEWRGYNITNSLEFADLEFTKTYEGQIYQDAAGNGNSTAVFSITGEFNGTEFYNNVLSANFTGEATETIMVKNLLVGATYTVEELEITDSGYEAKSDTKVTFLMTKEGPVKIGENESADVITISFTNEGDNKEKPNQGIINKYNFTSNGNSVNGVLYGPQKPQTETQAA